MTGVWVGGTAVAGTEVAVGGTEVAVGGFGVAVAGTGVAVGGTGVAVVDWLAAFGVAVAAGGVERTTASDRPTCDRRSGMPSMLVSATRRKVKPASRATSWSSAVVVEEERCCRRAAVRERDRAAERQAPNAVHRDDGPADSPKLA